jgi:hypothetical protein
MLGRYEYMLLVPYPSSFKVEAAFGKFKIYKSPGSDQIPTELIQAGGETLGSEIRQLTYSTSLLLFFPSFVRLIDVFNTLLVFSTLSSLL